MKNQLKPKVHEWTIIKLLEWTRSYFQSHGIESPRASAEILLAYTLGFDRIDLYVQYDKPLCKNELGKFKALIKRRIANEPVAYILETKEFWSIDFHVNQDVLIPRPETECLVEAAIDCLPDDASIEQKNVLELGTGSGAVIISIASERPNNLFFASDCSVNAVNIAKKNAVCLPPENRINFFSGDWFLPVNDNMHCFDIIISNPPYIQKKVIPDLCPEIYRYEPIIALDGGEDGLSSLKNIIMSAHVYLKKHGYLLLEIGDTQASDLKKIIDHCGKYDQVAFLKDYSGYDRILKIRLR